MALFGDLLQILADGKKNKDAENEPAESQAQPQAEEKKGYSVEEHAILANEGYKPRGIWFAKNNKMATKESVEKTLNESFSAIVIKKLDLIDAKVTSIADMFVREQQQHEIDVEEEQLKGKKKEKDTDSRYKDSRGPAISPILPFLIAANGVLGLLAQAASNILGVSKAALGAGALGAPKSISGVFKGFKGQKDLAKEAKMAESLEATAEEIGQTTKKEAILGKTGKALIKRLTPEAENAVLWLRKFGASIKNNPLLKKFSGIFKFALVIVTFSDALIDLILSGGQITNKFKEDFGGALGALAGMFIAEAGAPALGAFLGSIIPGPGTILGGAIGLVAGVLLSTLGATVGEYLGRKITEILPKPIGEGKDPAAVGEEIVKEIRDKATSVVQNVSKGLGSFVSGAIAFITGKKQTNDKQQATQVSAPAPVPPKKTTDTGPGPAKTAAAPKQATGQQEAAAKPLVQVDQPVGPVSNQRILDTIKKRESGGNYTAVNATASGAYQFTDTTWQGLTKKYNIGGEYARAKDAPPAIQDAVADRRVTEILKQTGGDVTKVPVVWYTGNPSGTISSAAIAANRGLTPEVYAANWMKTYNGSTAPDIKPTGGSARYEGGRNDYRGGRGEYGSGTYSGGGQIKVEDCCCTPSAPAPAPVSSAVISTTSSREMSTPPLMPPTQPVARKDNKGAQFGIPSPSAPFHMEDFIAVYFNVADVGFNQTTAIPI